MPPTKKLQPSDWLDLIAEKAPALRKAGVTSLDLDGVCIELAPVEPEYAQPGKGIRELADELSNPLDDAATYGMPDGFVPGYHLVESFDDDKEPN